MNDIEKEFFGDNIEYVNGDAVFNDRLVAESYLVDIERFQDTMRDAAEQINLEANIDVKVSLFGSSIHEGKPMREFLEDIIIPDAEQLETLSPDELIDMLVTIKHAVSKDKRRMDFLQMLLVKCQNENNVHPDDTYSAMGREISNYDHICNDLIKKPLTFRRKIDTIASKKYGVEDLTPQYGTQLNIDRLRNTLTGKTEE